MINGINPANAQLDHMDAMFDGFKLSDVAGVDVLLCAKTYPAQRHAGTQSFRTLVRFGDSCLFQPALTPSAIVSCIRSIPLSA